MTDEISANDIAAAFDGEVVDESNSKENEEFTNDLDALDSFIKEMEVDTPYASKMPYGSYAVHVDGFSLKPNKFKPGQMIASFTLTFKEDGRTRTFDTDNKVLLPKLRAKIGKDCSFVKGQDPKTNKPNYQIL